MEIRSIVASVIENLLKIIVAIFIIANVYRISMAAYDYGYRIFTEAPVSEAPGIDIAVEIPVGSDAAKIGEILEQRGLIHDAKVFRLQEFLSNYKGKLTAGYYTLNTSMTANEMMAVMAGAENNETESEES